MPLFMALHENLPQGTTANDVADYHAKDVSTHGEYGVKYLKFWIDEGPAAAHVCPRSSSCR
jgi:hypothetical protein